jgi:hypothetical protein
MAASTSAKIAHELDRHERRLAELGEEREKLAAQHAEVADLRGSAADKELAGDLAGASKLRGQASELEAKTSERELEMDPLTHRLETLIEDTRSELKLAIFEEAVDRRDRKAKAVLKAAADFAAALEPTIECGRKLSELRQEVDALDREARRLAQALTKEVEPIEDEPAFDGQGLLPLIQDGPRRPTAKAQAERKAREAEVANNDRKAIAKAVHDELLGDGWTRLPARLSPIERLPEPLRERAIDDFAKAAKQVSEVIRASREERLAELRELAKSGWARDDATETDRRPSGFVRVEA